jgi:enediyne polyketide synthase
MASIAASEMEVLPLCGHGGGDPEIQSTWVACVNAPDQTVVAGSQAAIDDLCRAAVAAGLEVVRLPVSHAFHTPAVAAAVDPFRDILTGFSVRPPCRRVVSTVTADDLSLVPSVSEVLARQLVAPVRFADAIRHVGDDVDLWIEVGPGRVLSRLARRMRTAPATSLDVGSASWRAVAGVVAALWTVGAPIDLSWISTGCPVAFGSFIGE